MSKWVHEDMRVKISEWKQLTIFHFTKLNSIKFECVALKYTIYEPMKFFSNSDSWGYFWKPQRNTLLWLWKIFKKIEFEKYKIHRGLSLTVGPIIFYFYIVSLLVFKKFIELYFSIIWNYSYFKNATKSRERNK